VTTVAAIQEALQRTARRRQYQAQLHIANQRLADLATPRPSATEYLGRLLDYAPIGITTLDQQGAVVGWNRTASVLLQRSEREVLGQPFVSLFPTTEHAALKRLQDLAETTDRASPPTLVQTTTQGQVLWLQMTATALPIAARVHGTLLLFEDVTARVHAEQERESSQQRLSFLAELGLILGASLEYHTTLARLAEALVPTLADWCIIDVVEAEDRLDRVAIATADPARAVSLHALRERYPLTWDSRQPAVEALRQRKSLVFPTFSSELLAATARDPDHLKLLETLNPQSVVAVPIMVRDRAIGVMTLVRTVDTPTYTEQDLQFAEDIASRAALVIENTRLYAEAQRAIHLRDEFLSLAAHELRTPVTTVLGSAQLLQRHLAQSPAVTDRDQRRIQTLIDQVGRLQRLIQTLLDPARIEAGLFLIERIPMDLSVLVRQILDALQPTLHKYEVVMLGLDTPCMIEGDRMRLEQVVQNILQNAIKYSPQGGVIRVELEHHAEQVELTITDHGIGIPEDEIARITERFYRAANVQASNFSGMGIGLYLVNAIVTAHGGILRIASQQGVGTQIQVSLPRGAGPSPVGVHREMG
jgi:PAS domain S-box-containing protein